MCQSCEVVKINGIVCHELDCPDAWIGLKVRCLWCGQEFVPKEKNQRLCSEECAESFNG
jgi:hypothetical protein